DAPHSPLPSWERKRSGGSDRSSAFPHARAARSVQSAGPPWHARSSFDLLAIDQSGVRTVAAQRGVQRLTSDAETAGDHGLRHTLVDELVRGLHLVLGEARRLRVPPARAGDRDALGLTLLDQRALEL